MRKADILIVAGPQCCTFLKWALGLLGSRRLPDASILCAQCVASCTQHDRQNNKAVLFHPAAARPTSSPWDHLARLLADRRTCHSWAGAILCLYLLVRVVTFCIIGHFLLWPSCPRPGWPIHTIQRCDEKKKPVSLDVARGCRASNLLTVSEHVGDERIRPFLATHAIARCGVLPPESRVR